MKGKIFLAIFISILMVSSILGIITYSGSDSNSQSLDYYGTSFEVINGKYYLEFEGKNYLFDNSPYDLENVQAGDFALNSNKYYILFNPDERDNNMEYFIQKLYLTLNSRGYEVQLACDREENCDVSLPIKSCSDNAFYIKKSGDAKVYKEDNCFVLEGDDSELNRLVDKVDLKILGL